MVGMRIENECERGHDLRSDEAEAEAVVEVVKEKIRQEGGVEVANGSS